MEQIDEALGANLGAVVIVLAVLLLVALVLLLQTRSKLSKLQEKYDFFTKGEQINIDQLLVQSLTRLDKSEEEIAQLQGKHHKLQEQVNTCLQVVKVKRYDAFEAMGGEMSYSVLLADAKQNGMILTSIYGREESRCFAKAINEGKSNRPLSQEEKELL